MAKVFGFEVEAYVLETSSGVNILPFEWISFREKKVSDALRKTPYHIILAVS